MRFTRTLMFLAFAGLVSHFAMPFVWLGHDGTAVHAMIPSHGDHSHDHGHDHPATTPDHDHGVFGELSGASATVVRAAAATTPSLHAEPLASTDASCVLSKEAHATPHYVPPNQSALPPREFLSILLI